MANCSVVLFLSLVVVFGALHVQSQTCACHDCSKSTSINPMGSFFASYACTSSLAEVSSIHVQTTGGGGVYVYTRPSMDSTVYYTRASSPTPVTCFVYNNLNVGNSSSIVVQFQCNNGLLACHVSYNIQFQCVVPVPQPLPVTLPIIADIQLKSGLSMIQIIGIIAGGVALLAIVIVVVCCICYRRRARNVYASSATYIQMHQPLAAAAFVPQTPATPTATPVDNMFTGETSMA